MLELLSVRDASWRAIHADDLTCDVGAFVGHEQRRSRGNIANSASLVCNRFFRHQDYLPLKPPLYYHFLRLPVFFHSPPPQVPLIDGRYNHLSLYTILSPKAKSSGACSQYIRPVSKTLDACRAAQLQDKHVSN
jgi:hypothetical protein